MLNTTTANDRNERITAGQSISLYPSVLGVTLRTLVSAVCGARSFSTGLAAFEPGAVLPYHEHDCSEAITVLSGEATVLVEGRSYQLQPLDCIHVPRGVAHSVRNDSSKNLQAHTAFGSDSPQRLLVSSPAEPQEAGGSESVRRKADSDVYELSPGAYFTDLFARRFGSSGVCGGYGRFNPGSSLPCHIHVYDESITIVEGTATCLVKGKRYQLSNLETAFVPTGRPHRFINESDEYMAMVWVYAGDEPDRVILNDGYCSGTTPQS